MTKSAHSGRERFEKVTTELTGGLYAQFRDTPLSARTVWKYWVNTESYPKEYEDTSWKFHICMDAKDYTDEDYFEIAADIMEYCQEHDGVGSKQVYDLGTLKALGEHERVQAGKAISVYLYLERPQNNDYYKVQAFAEKTAKGLDKLLLKRVRPARDKRIHGDAKVPTSRSGLLFYRYAAWKPGPGSDEQCDHYRSNSENSRHNIKGNPDIFADEDDNLAPVICPNTDGTYHLHKDNKERNEYWCPLCEKHYHPYRWEK